MGEIEAISNLRKIAKPMKCIAQILELANTNNLQCLREEKKITGVLSDTHITRQPRITTAHARNKMKNSKNNPQHWDQNRTVLSLNGHNDWPVSLRYEIVSVNFLHTQWFTSQTLVFLPIPPEPASTHSGSRPEFKINLYLSVGTAKWWKKKSAHDLNHTTSSVKNDK